MELFKRLLKAFFPPTPTKRNERERFLLPQEWIAVQSSLAHKPLKIRVFFLLIFLTGCRRDELRKCSWAQLDLDAAIWHKLETKNGKRQVLPLSPEAVALFRELPTTGRYCFQGDLTKGATCGQPWSRSAVKYWWRKIRHESACQDVQIRDLRRSTASWMTMEGENLKVIQKLLDHTSLSTTQIYARLDLKSLREALNRHAQRIFR
jgi:integrase